MSFHNKDIHLTNSHDSIELLDITNGFASLNIIKQNITNLFYKLRSRADTLKNEYTNYVTRNKSKMHFGLDSFHFQSTMLEYEFKTLWNQFQMILNRIYCEYYKFFKIIVKYVTETFADEPALILLCKPSKYPVYKDLEPLKEYDFDITSALFDNIVKIVHYLINMHNNNTKTINNIYSSNDGFNIENYVDTLVFNTAIVNEKIKLYEKYLNVFNKYHICYLSRLDIKLTILWGQVNYDLNTELNKKPNNVDYKYQQMQNDAMVNNGLSVKSIKELDNIFSHVGEIEEQEQVIVENVIENDNNKDMNSSIVIPTEEPNENISMEIIHTNDNVEQEHHNLVGVVNDIEYNNIMDEIEQSLREKKTSNYTPHTTDHYLIEETHLDHLGQNEPSNEIIEPVLNEPIKTTEEENSADIDKEPTTHHETKLEHIEDQVIHYGMIAVNQAVNLLDNEKLKKKLKKARHKLNVKNKQNII